LNYGLPKILAAENHQYADTRRRNDGRSQNVSDADSRYAFISFSMSTH
jgi:hypothetical protein